ncbi:MAG TPA: lysophospholipid acyltransferase family protein [Tepidisphaeraceae bacterium]|nr:lysophospholipid acyltransferase family protein [Tepidisphaeraceae bacterium]
MGVDLAGRGIFLYFPPRVIAWGRPIDRPENRLDVRLLGWANLAFSRLYHQVHLRRPPCLPPTGPAILVSNHVSGLDPLLIQSCCKRLVIWMMAHEYYDVKALGWVYRTVRAIPVERSGRDLAATRAALRALHDGHILGIFPEGRIAASRELLPFQTGVALMAIKAKVPVYPVYLDGTQRGKEMLQAVLLPNQAAITFGPPVNFDRSSTSRDALDVATEKIRDAIKCLATFKGPCV